MKISIGADPEVFVKQKGSFISAHNLIPGTKEHPYPVNLGAVQVDGMALEFNIDPAQTLNEFVRNIQTVLSSLRAMVPDYELAIDPVAEFTRAYMQQLPDEVCELGCNKDFNAWMQQVNEPPNAEATFRTAAGHIHIGWLSQDIKNPMDIGHMNACETIVKQLDFYLGLPSLLYDQDTIRRKLYGNAGAYRPKTYGLEYRVLSNQWLKNTKRIKWVYQATQDAINNLLNGNILCDKYGDIQKIINGSNIQSAQNIIDAEKLKVCHV